MGKARSMSAAMVSRFEIDENAAGPVGDASWLRFAQLCETLAATPGKLAKRAAIADYLRGLDAPTAGTAAQYLTGTVFAESDARKVQAGSRVVVDALESLTGATPAVFHAAYRKHGDLGAAAAELLASSTAERSRMTLDAIAAQLAALATARGKKAKFAVVVETLRALGAVEAKYFIKLLLGDMRMGVKQSLVEEAIAVAAQEKLADVRRAETMLGDLAEVVALAWRHDLQAARFRMFHSLGFMLATPAASAEEVYARLGGGSRAEAALEGSVEGPERSTGQREAAAESTAQISAQIEDMYDGMRAQVHCGDPAQPGRVRIFSRTREDITDSFPELAEWFSAVRRPGIVDGEILAWDGDADRARPFTALQPRLGRKRVSAAMLAETQVIFQAFDLLLDERGLLLDQPLRERRAALERWTERAVEDARVAGAGVSGGNAQSEMFAMESAAEGDARPPRLLLAPAQRLISAAQVEAAFVAAQARGNEGLMVKALDSIYEPGRRGAAWLKLKRELATLDVVVTAVEYGHGRRAAVLSDYTFAVREGTELRNIGKAYSGLTDVEIREMTEWFLAHTVDTQGGQLLVEPKIVLEVAFNNVMRSERHNSGYSLRFPRIVRLRPDKPVEEIDTLERVEEIFQSQHGQTTLAEAPPE